MRGDEGRCPQRAGGGVDGEGRHAEEASAAPAPGGAGRVHDLPGAAGGGGREEDEAALSLPPMRGGRKGALISRSDSRGGGHENINPSLRVR